jgi:hypothetical protein
MNNRSGRRDLSAPHAVPCPSWCDGSCELTYDPADEFMHRSAPVILAVTGGSSFYPQTSLEVCIESWVPSLAGRPTRGVITWSVDGAPGPSLTLREARSLAWILLALIGQVQDGPPRHGPDVRCAYRQHWTCSGRSR